ncbi:hypothetical protein WOLCODRAFT_124897 [Wolfiporia cocos MD-104 SS10]|uniref:Protein phosphatase n=1 Tax=Wolfiporia cocos (strain MD-104) TaxID=742152 RepID=A0A2H3J4L4_WOLCO|nr:hypothetical protein WOLCODRAFT_124897 [Wolfiporia cocos MD-104 SS10]
MGVADGVGGWSRVRRNTKGGDSGPSPSALFARRLMHYCSEEVEAASAESSADSSALETLSDIDADELRMELEDTLEDLEDGIDILQIFENAYEKTMQAHVCPDDAHSDPRPTTAPHDSSSSAHIPPAGQSARSPEQAASTHSLSSSSWSSVLSPPPPKTKRLIEGSSTALLAVLEHPTARSRSRPHGLFSPSPRTAPGPAVIRIAHLGDSMGMLIRGDEIVWRTDEMWWNFNTPVQLGPASPTRPRDAQVCTLPVQADDILILASDGLSDNLWDEDVLDEVVRARRPFLAAASASATPAQQTGVRGQLGRQALAAMLSEALCSRARRVAEMRRSPHRKEGESDGEDEEIPFARRAREHGKAFRGGKPDDISVLVAVVSPVQTP